MKCKLLERAVVIQSHHHPDFRFSGSAWFIGCSYAAFQSACTDGGVLEVGKVGWIWLIRNSLLRGREKDGDVL